LTVRNPDEPNIDLARAKLGPAEAAIFETFVVPRYLSAFGDLVIEMLAEGEDAQVAHLLCRTGFPDRGVAEKLPGAHIYGCDPSQPAVELARVKAATMPDMFADYRVADTLPVPLPEAAFSHAFSLYPLVRSPERIWILRECARLLAPHGQALIAVPMRGSFQEVFDLLREYALKNEAVDVTQAVEQAAASRPTMEVLGAEMEDAGFHYVDVELRTSVHEFQSGRAFFEDPIARLLVLPELRASLATLDMERPFAYVREAIDKYWSEGAFTLTVNVGCASGRRVAPAQPT
jgi:SAM-dependent methyltransferase